MILVCINVSCNKDNNSSSTNQEDPEIQEDTVVPASTINGVFSVGEHKKIMFSKGNLQYQASTKTWRFADNQWDYIGNANINISYNYSGWIDLFGWGTGNNPSNNSSILGDYGFFYDWGNNIIPNSGNSTNHWYTLSKGEWDFVFRNRTTISGVRYVKAIVNGNNGVILLPDNWDMNTYSLHTGIEYSANQIDASNWIILESAGAVFLPAGGFRNPYANVIKNVGTGGYYWATTINGDKCAYCVNFYDEGFKLRAYLYRRNGMSVRLVCDAQ